MIKNIYNNKNSDLNNNRGVLNNKKSISNTNILPNTEKPVRINYSENKQKLERICFRIDKTLVVGESEFSLLYKIDGENKCWIPKKVCFGSVFTNWINVKPVVNSKIKGFNDEGEFELSVEQLKEIVEENEVNKQWM